MSIKQKKNLKKKDLNITFDIPYTIHKSMIYNVKFNLFKTKIRKAELEETYVIESMFGISSCSDAVYKSFKALKFDFIPITEIHQENYTELVTETTTTYWSDGDKDVHKYQYEQPATKFHEFTVGWTIFKKFSSKEELENFEKKFPTLFTTYFKKFSSFNIMKLFHKVMDVFVFDVLARTVRIVFLFLVGLAHVLILSLIFIKAFSIILHPVMLSYFGIALISDFILAWYYGRLYFIKVKHSRLIKTEKCSRFDYEQVPDKLDFTLKEMTKS